MSDINDIYCRTCGASISDDAYSWKEYCGECADSKIKKAPASEVLEYLVKIAAVAPVDSSQEQDGQAG
jgi:hypothetical protein